MTSQDQTPKIRILSTSTINAVPLTESVHRINLTPWDLELLFLEHTQIGLLFLKPNPQQEATILSKTNTASLIHHLKASLERTLHFFSPSSAASQPPILTTVPPPVSSLIATTMRKGHFSFMQLHWTRILLGTHNHDGVSQPLLAVQVTELVDGLFIGCSINHLLADATSFWHFFNSWAEISRGENVVHDPISKLPILDRDQLTLDLVGSSDIKIYNEYLILDKVSAAHESPCLLRDRVFHFTKESVAKLKARANKEVVESKGQISSLQAVIAHVWRSIIRCRSAMNSGTQETTFEIPIGARQRLNPPLPEEYFGNSVFPGIVTTEAWKILENGLGWTSRQIHKMVASANGPDKVKEFYMSWIKKPNFLQFDGLPSNHFILINSPRFDVYGNDFGWGKPVAARSGRANGFDGRITIYGGFEKGSLEIEACLFPETLSALVNDAEFMEFVKSDF
ncbi:putative acetyltransferase [Sesamum angolense]|uniref:Acetyltransferase n=1 Tax=Sesamum angolense TaxID=2727404 RepID=A0AAE1WBV6_9LAMI|nr:putative acetyltransferase [Sesamum angolense]